MHPIIKAALWMMGTLFSFMAMAVGGRLLSQELNTFQILFFRSLVGFCCLAFLLQRSGWNQVITRQFPLHLVRNLAHFGGQFGWFFGIASLPLAEVFAIEFTVPLWTAGLAPLLLQERMTSSRFLAVGLGLAGMLLILKPGLAAVHPAALAVLGGAGGYALSHTLTRKLTVRDAPLAILFYMTAIQLPLGFFLSLHGWTTPSLPLLPWLLVVGLAALSAHYCLANALTLADVTVVVPLDFLRLPLIALVGFVFFGEGLEWSVFFGALVMLGGNLANIRAEKRRRT